MVAPNPRLQRTSAAVLAQSIYCWHEVFGGVRRSPLSRKPLGDGTKAMAAVAISLAAVAVLVSQSLLYE
jgi:hypothetical protein